MKKHRGILFIIMLGLLASGIFAQEAPKDSAAANKYGWKNGLVVGLNFNQSQFSNWSKGGENTVAWQLLVNGNFNYLRPKYNVNTGFKINYGRNTVGDQGDRKTNDEIRLDVVYNRKINFLVNPYAAVRFLSQLDKGYEYTDTSAIQKSGRFDPAYLSFSLGAGYQYNELLMLNFGPSLKGTFADVFAHVYTDDPATTEVEKQKWEGGLEFSAKLNWEIYKDFLLNSNLLTFTDFKNFETDVNWDNTLVAKVNNWLNFNIQFQMIYDEDVSTDLQLRQALSIGVSYTLF